MSLPRVTPLSSLTDYAALQDDLTFLLLSHAALRQVNVIQERKFLMDASLQLDSLWLTPRNGGQGLGIVVEDIRPDVRNPDTPGPICNLLCQFVIVEERNINRTAGIGTFIIVEQAEQIVIDLLHLKVLQPYGQLRAEGRCGAPAEDWIEPDSGIYARRVTLRLLNARRQTETCDTLTISETGGTVTLTCTSAAPDVQIYYTEDGSFPASDLAVNPQTKIYTAPFAAASGTVIRACAYAVNYNSSAIKQLTVP